MLSFLNKGYKASNYAKFRPQYPQNFFEYIVQYHQAQNRTQTAKPTLALAVDVACGTGQATRLLANYSTKVVGVDFSEPMIAEAQKTLPKLPNVEFVVGNDTTLSTRFAPGSVDLLTVAEGAHWLKYPEFWQQAVKILRPGGTLGIWGYHTFAFPQYPEVANIIRDFAYAKDQCGPHWSQGREILDQWYVPLLQSLAAQSNFSHIEYHTNSCDKLRPHEPLELVRDEVPLHAVAGMLKTWSAYYNYAKKHPDLPDLVDMTLAKILEATKLNIENRVQIKWNTMYLLATKSA